MDPTTALNSRVLVIDDDPVVRESFRTVLEPRAPSDDAVRAAASVLYDEGPLEPIAAARPMTFELDLAEDGARGVAMARRAVEAGAPYAVIFCDVRMPGLDGLETVERIRAFDPRAEVVFVTAYSDHSVAHIVERAGANVGYFVKPFLSDEVQQLATKLVVEWNKARELETLVRAVAALRGEQADVHRLVEHLLRQVCLWLDTDSAALLRRTQAGRFVFDLGVGRLRDGDAVRAVTERLNGALDAVPESSVVTAMGDDTLVLPVHAFGVAIALSGRARITSDRRFLLEVFLENAALALRNCEMSTRLGEAERLAAAGRALGFVLHDVRNPIGTAQLLARTVRMSVIDRPEALEALAQVDFELQRAVELLGDTLALCRGALAVRPRAMDLAAALRDARSSWRVELSHRGVRVDVLAPERLEAWADPPRLARALYNLTRNAADAVASREHPAVEVGARRVEGGVELRVTDDGPGVPESVLPALFQPFATAGKEDGTGFGLAIVRQVAEAHGGRADYRREGGRSTFTVFLPDRATA